MIFEICGWLGCIFLACCAAPETFSAIKNKHSGITWGLLILWFFGEVFMLIYSVSLGNWPLLLNYGANILLLLPVLWYKTYSKKKE